MPETEPNVNTTKPPALSKSQKIAKIQNVFSDSQKIAYCGICYLSILQYKTRRLEPLLNPSALESYDRWAKSMFMKLFLYLELSPEEQEMIHQLPEHGIQVTDLSTTLLNDARNASQHLLADSDSDSDDESIPSDIRYTVLSHLFIICVADGHFDARSRTLLRITSTYLQINWLNILHLEKTIAEQLRLCDTPGKLQKDDDVVGKRNKLDGRRRWLYMGLATLAGGAVIGLTAGLAAPFIGAGIGAALTTVGVSAGAAVTGTLTGTAGIAIITSTGVLTGGGMGGFKMLKRTRGITEFEFLSIAEGMKRIEENKRQRFFKRTGTLPESTNVQQKPKSKPDLQKKISDDVLFAATEEFPGFATSAADTDLSASPSTAIALNLDVDKSNRGNTNVLITISGFLTCSDDFTLPFSTLIPGLHGDQYSLVWESKALLALGSTLSIIVSEMASFLVQQGIQAFALPMLMAALTGPMWALKLSYLIDNPWGIGLTKAKKAGKVLADTLLSQVQEQRPVTLIGYSLGARVIYFCLEELAARDGFGIVEEVYLFGTPVMATQKDWAKIASVLSGRIVNGYMKNDYVLGVLYRASSAVWNTVAGLGPVNDVCGIENVCVDGIINGHMEYRIGMPKILKMVGFVVSREEFEDEEDEMERVEAEILRRKKFEEKKRSGWFERRSSARKKRPDIIKPTPLEKKLEKENPELWSELLKEAKDVGEARRLLVLYTQPKELKSTMPTLILAPKELESTMPPLVLNLNVSDKVSHATPPDHAVAYGAGDLADRDDLSDDEDAESDSEEAIDRIAELDEVPMTVPAEVSSDNVFAHHLKETNAEPEDFAPPLPSEATANTWSENKTKEIDVMDQMLKKKLEEDGFDMEHEDDSDAWASAQTFSGILPLHNDGIDATVDHEVHKETESDIAIDDEFDNFNDWANFTPLPSESVAVVAEPVKESAEVRTVSDVPEAIHEPVEMDEPVSKIADGFAGFDLDDPWQ